METERAIQRVSVISLAEFNHSKILNSSLTEQTDKDYTMCCVNGLPLNLKITL